VANESERIRADAQSMALIDRARERHRGLPVTDSPAFEIGQLLQVLIRHDVHFVVIGGIAMRFHDPDRLTRDLDICYERTRANCRSLARALASMDAHSRAASDVRLDESTLMHGAARFFMLVTRFGWLDLLPVPTGTQGYEELVSDAELVDIDGIRMLIASRQALLRMKRAADRAIDRKDVLFLEDPEHYHERKHALDTQALEGK
jgi:hypothetical protein